MLYEFRKFIIIYNHNFSINIINLFLFKYEGQMADSELSTQAGQSQRREDTKEFYLREFFQKEFPNLSKFLYENLLKDLKTKKYK